MREYRQGECKHFQEIILHHIPIVDALVWKYATGTHHRYEDILEVAYYELVVATKQAQRALRDDNITPYLITCVGLNLLSFVTLDHLTVYPKKVSSCVTPLMSRYDFNDTVDVRCREPVDYVVFWERFNNAITDDVQREIVDLRLAGYTYVEIWNRLPNIHLTTIKDKWKKFVDRMENANTDL